MSHIPMHWGIYDTVSKQLLCFLENNTMDLKQNESYVDLSAYDLEVGLDPAYYTIENNLLIKKKDEDITLIEQKSVRNLHKVTQLQLLAASDWTQLLDSNLTSQKRAEWAFYRKTIRDMDMNTIDLTQISFPNKPTS